MDQLRCKPISTAAPHGSMHTKLVHGLYQLQRITTIPNPKLNYQPPKIPTFFSGKHGCHPNGANGVELKNSQKPRFFVCVEIQMVIVTTFLSNTNPCKSNKCWNITNSNAQCPLISYDAHVWTQFTMFVSTNAVCLQLENCVGEASTSFWTPASAAIMAKILCACVSSLQYKLRPRKEQPAPRFGWNVLGPFPWKYSLHSEVKV